MNILGVSHTEIPKYVAPVRMAHALSQTAAVSAKMAYAKIEAESIKDARQMGVELCAQSEGTFRGIEEDYVGKDILTYHSGLFKKSTGWAVHGF